MPWVKGQSGNPGGRTKKYMEIRDLAQKASPAAFRTLKHLAKNAKNESARIAASTAILDRALGKPATVHTGEGGQGPILASLEVTFVKSDGETDGKG